MCWGTSQDSNTCTRVKILWTSSPRFHVPLWQKGDFSSLRHRPYESVQIERVNTGGTCWTQGKSLNGRDHLRNLSVDGRVILNWIWKKCVRMCAAFMWLSRGSCGGLLWTEPSGSMKGGEFLYHASDSHVMKKSAPWSLVGCGEEPRESLQIHVMSVGLCGVGMNCGG